MLQEAFRQVKNSPENRKKVPQFAIKNAMRSLVEAGVKDVPMQHSTEKIITLTPRELEVLKLARDGLNSRQTAEAQGNLSMRTIRTQRLSIRHKLGAKSMKEAISKAYKIEIIDRPDIVEIPIVERSIDKRERDILQEMAKGSSNKEIGAKLFFSEGSIYQTVSLIYQKLGAKSRLKATIIAEEQGLIDLAAATQDLYVGNVTNLTKRQRDLLDTLISTKNETGKELADYYSISVRTIEQHRQQIIQRLEVANIIQAVMLYMHAKKIGKI